MPPFFHLVILSASLLSSPFACLAWKRHPSCAFNAPNTHIGDPALTFPFTPPLHFTFHCTADEFAMPFSYQHHRPLPVRLVPPHHYHYVRRHHHRHQLYDVNRYPVTFSTRSADRPSFLAAPPAGTSSSPPPTRTTPQSSHDD